MKGILSHFVRVWIKSFCGTVWLLQKQFKIIFSLFFRQFHHSRRSCSFHQGLAGLTDASPTEAVHRPQSNHGLAQSIWSQHGAGDGPSTKEHSSLWQGTLHALPKKILASHPQHTQQTGPATACPALKQKPQVTTSDCLQTPHSHRIQKPLQNSPPGLISTHLLSTFLHWTSNKTNMWFWKKEVSHFFRAD